MRDEMDTTLPPARRRRWVKWAVIAMVGIVGVAGAGYGVYLETATVVAETCRGEMSLKNVTYLGGESGYLSEG